MTSKCLIGRLPLPAMLLAVLLYAAACRAEAATLSVVDAVRPSPAQPGGLVILQGEGLSGLTTLLVAGRAPARVTPVNDRVVAFVLPNDLPPGPATIDIWFLSAPPLASTVLIAGPDTGAEPLDGAPDAGASPTPVEPASTPTPPPATATPTPPPATATPANPSPGAPGPFILPSVVPIPRGEPAPVPAKQEGRGNSNGNGNGNGNGRGNGGAKPGRGR